MEKLMYLLWKNPGQNAEQFRDGLLESTLPALQKTNTKRLRLTVIDQAVAPAEKLFIRHLSPSPDAIISFWLDTAINRHAQEALMENSSAKIAGYLVTESEPLVNHQHPTTAGERTYGMNQVVLLRKPDRLDFEEWIDIWQNSHTEIAIQTQSTFGYRQNTIIRTLTKNAPSLAAIVEENFPPEAMISAEHFYNASGNKALMKENRETMFSSVKRFVDFDRLDCLPMSEYNQ